jgi:hypothetical protein
MDEESSFRSDVGNEDACPCQPAGRPPKMMIPSVGKKLGELDWNESLNN